MEQELIGTLMAQNTQDNGGRINSMGREQKYGLMELSTKENTNTGRSTGRARTSGLTGGSIREIGKITRCTDKAVSNGLTAESSWENTDMIKRKASESSPGQMERVTAENGMMGSSMAVAPS